VVRWWEVGFESNSWTAWEIRQGRGGQRRGFVDDVEETGRRIKLYSGIKRKVYNKKSWRIAGQEVSLQDKSDRLRSRVKRAGGEDEPTSLEEWTGRSPHQAWDVDGWRGNGRARGG
jgi:hypothetical protein